MSNGENLPPIRRILISLDASASGTAALETAVALASRMEAELLGLFVEDVNLLRFAALPFAREMSFFSARIRRLDIVGMERALRAQASRAEATLIETAGRQRVRCSFRVVRGEVTTQLLAASQDIDLIALGVTRRQFHRISPTVRGIIDATRSSVLLLPTDARINAPVTVVYDGSPASIKALSVARQLSQMQEGILTVLFTEKTESPKAEVAEQLEGSGLVVRYRSLPSADMAGVAQGARREAAGTLVLSTSLCLKAGALEYLLEQLDCAVLLVR
ncbi:MAG: universal stress protein [Gammaproteobacteria bacterium]|nr:universal stress protein [Gammaproteobacteria bacterium]